MRNTWFFATTPAPRPAMPERHEPFRQALRRWSQRAGARLVAWGENAQHHRLGSWQRMR